MSLFLAPREAAVWWATGLSQNHNHTVATGAESTTRLHKLLFHNYSNSVLLSTSRSPSILERKILPASCMSWPFHSLIKNLWRWDLKDQPSSFTLPNVISSQFFRFCSERPRYLPTSTRPVMDTTWRTADYTSFFQNAAKWRNAKLYLQPKEKFIRK